MSYNNTARKRDSVTGRISFILFPLTVPASQVDSVAPNSLP